MNCNLQTKIDFGCPHPTREFHFLPHALNSSKKEGFGVVIGDLDLSLYILASSWFVLGFILDPLGFVLSTLGASWPLLAILAELGS